MTSTPTLWVRKWGPWSTEQRELTFVNLTLCRGLCEALWMPCPTSFSGEICETVKLWSPGFIWWTETQRCLVKSPKSPSGERDELGFRNNWFRFSVQYLLTLTTGQGCRAGRPQHTLLWLTASFMTLRMSPSLKPRLLHLWEVTLTPTSLIQVCLSKSPARLALCVLQRKLRSSHQSLAFTMPASLIEFLHPQPCLIYQGSMPTICPGLDPRKILLQILKVRRMLEKNSLFEILTSKCYHFISVWPWVVHVNSMHLLSTPGK